ncbi:MAG: hypothetical protein AAF908_02510 [Pseudomonadota bacterium]
MSAEDDALAERGWAKFAADEALSTGVEAARPLAEEIALDPINRADWLRCGGTWFAGVNIFPNEADGSVPWRVPPLSGRAFKTALSGLGLARVALDQAQISICYPGYPQPWEGESVANFRFRRDRDAAHLDGLTRDAARRRSLSEVHGFILGLPLTDVPVTAAPLVVWEGSHEVIRSAFRARFAGIAPADWAREDVTEFYAETRRQIFAECRRVVVHARPGEAYLVHRLAIHGVAPWGEDGGETPRIVAYFRPDPFPGADPGWWLEMP